VLEIHPFPALGTNATSADRSTLPMPQTFPDAPFPDFEQTTLRNGMRLIVAERNAVPVVRFSLQLDAGYAADQFAAPGVATMTMEMLDEGTATMDALEINDTLLRLGAQLSSGANLDSSVVGLSALKENLDESLAVYADVILNPAFAPEELERLKALQLASIQQEKNTPEDMALRVLPQLLYGDGHAYAMPLTGSGTEQAVAALERDDLVAYHDSWFKPSNATMIVVGDTTLADIQPKLEALFARWRAGEVPEKSLPDVALPTQQSVYLIDRPGAEQSVIIAGHLIGPRDAADDIAVAAMNDILGGAFTSRVNMNLREDKGWSYGADTVVVETQAQRPFLAIAPVQADQTAASMQEIKREIEEFVGARAATEAEVATSKRRSTLSLPGRWETAQAVARDIAELVRFRLPDDYWDDYAELVGALEVADVSAAAEQHLRPKRLTWLVVGDLDVIEAEVRALSLGEIRVVDVDGNAMGSP
jgi:zinc protease